MDSEITGYNFTPNLHDDTYDLIDPRKLDLAGKNVLITGASRGVGKAMALSFGKAGASGIILGARSPLDQVAEEVKKAAKDYGRPEPTVLTLKMDTTNRAEVEAAAQVVTDKFGQVDILINNAGYLETAKPIAESDPDEWWKTFEVNVKGVYLVSRSFLPLVLKSQQKIIVSVSSIGAHLTGAGQSAYQTSKTTVLRLNNFLMAEYGHDGLIAFAIHPGGVVTDLANGLPKEMRDKVLIDQPELCGDCVPWLTSERRDWMADRYISVTWDMAELLSKKDDIVSKDLLKVKLRA